MTISYQEEQQDLISQAQGTGQACESLRVWLQG